MKIRYAVLADAANVSQEGKTNILGIFTNLQTSKVPCILPKSVLVVMTQPETGDTATSGVLRIEIVDPEANILIETQIDVDFGQIVLRGQHVTFLNIEMFRIPYFGDYEIRLWLGEESETVCLAVLPIEEATQ